jgi:hypothetical protein
MPSKVYTTLTAPLVLHRTRLDKCAMKEIGINGQVQNKLYLIVIHRFSLVKAAMITLPICKVPNVLAKHPQFLFFNCPSAQWIFSEAI